MPHVQIKRGGAHSTQHLRFRMGFSNIPLSLPPSNLSCSLSRSLFDPPTLGRMICIANYKPTVCACVRKDSTTTLTTCLPCSHHQKNLLLCARVKETHTHLQIQGIFFFSPLLALLKKKQSTPKEGRTRKKRTKEKRCSKFRGTTNKTQSS